jgi:Holliday junction resolvase
MIFLRAVLPCVTAVDRAAAMSGAKHRRKGSRIEREIVHLHTSIGIHAERVPLSGAAGGHFSGDVKIYIDGPDEAPLVTEIKARKNGAGFVTLENWLGENDALFLRRDRAEPIVVIPWRTWCRLVGRRP